MKEHSFVLKEDGIIYWIENFPELEYTRLGDPRFKKWGDDQKSAISNAVEVSNQEEVEKRFNLCGMVMAIGEVYSLQCSIDVKKKEMGSSIYEVALVTFDSPPVEEQREILTPKPDSDGWNFDYGLILKITRACKDEHLSMEQVDKVMTVLCDIGFSITRKS
jgi:hypothetical protein